MSLGIYNTKYFTNNPSEATKPGVLYCVVLVSKATGERVCLKIGIAKGKNWKDVIKRSGGFKGYEIRIQKTVSGNLIDIYYLEQYLHELWQEYKYTKSWKFGGHTELFDINKLSEILKSIPDKV